MAFPRISYSDRGQGISVFSACYPSHPLDPQTSAVVLLSGSAWGKTLSAGPLSLAADDYAWIGYCDRR